MSTAPEYVSLRCPGELRKLLAKLRLEGGAPRVVQPANLMELSCSDCSRDLRRSTGDRVRVLHRFDFSGEFIESEVQDLED